MFYKYIIKFDSGEEKTIDIELDPSTLNITPKITADFPEWTLLDYGKCIVCPFNDASHKYCPIAQNLAEVTNMFSDKASTMIVDARVVTKEREYFKRTSLQSALSSVIGIYMVTSGCPVMEILKPMARHHLPFASLNETVFRSISSYLLQQYFRKKKGLEPDWELQKLGKAYETIEVLNRAIVDRVRRASQKDANYNALIILDVFAKMVPFTIDQSLPTKEFRHPDH
ncbi:MAG: hypothetical protein Q7R35_11440 [Elusimicrobiota bacterium]|nr:hypothetical protein [Elusimicrobiota bacterium]